MEQFLRLDTEYLQGFVSQKEMDAIMPMVRQAHRLLENRSGPGGEFLGWIDLPERMAGEPLAEIDSWAGRMRESSDIIIVIGIGGSYLGARAVIEALSAGCHEKEILFAGYNLCGYQLNAILDIIEKEEKEVAVNVISKSGTTTEPALAFRIIETALKKRYSAEGARERVVCTTDKEKGALRDIARARGYKTFYIPPDVGGRFSVFTPVGLFPIACAGIDIGEFIAGAQAAQSFFRKYSTYENISYKYAAVRNILYRAGKVIEIFSSFDFRFHYIGEWWKQLFAESEGKESRGIFPSLCDFTTDLHSVGQLIQEGARNMFETFLVTEKEEGTCVIPGREDNRDGLDYLAGKTLAYVNQQAYKATALAHFRGSVPNMTVFLPERSAFYIGALLYFFEKAVAASGYMLGINPFDQPGVESYKKEMFRLLGKPKPLRGQS